jgi:predicted aspartyl protease
MENRMGIFYTSCRVENHVNRNKAIGIPRLLVDSGSESTWIEAAKLRKIGVQPAKKDLTFVMANGQRITRSIGYAILRVGEYETIDEVVFAERGDLELLGARTLEGLNLRVDPRAKKLVNAGPILAAESFACEKAADKTM